MNPPELGRPATDGSPAVSYYTRHNAGGNAENPFTW